MWAWMLEVSVVKDSAVVEWYQDTGKLKGRVSNVSTERAEAIADAYRRRGFVTRVRTTGPAARPTTPEQFREARDWCRTRRST